MIPAIFLTAQMENKLRLSVFLLLLVAWKVHAQLAVNCTATGAGRFADPGDTTCNNYTFCVFIPNSNSFVSYNYVCPTSSVFNPASSQCTAATNYVCNVTVPVDTAPSVCTEDSFVADPNSTNCSSYIQCVNIDGTFTETIFICPDDTFFNPNSTLCEPNYVCITPFTCTAVGRYANPNDATCQTYFMCVLANNGTFLEYQYTCPTSSVFSPTAGFCTTAYTCAA